MGDLYPMGSMPTGEHAFQKLRKEDRERIEAMLKNWLWTFACATASGYTQEGRIMPTLPREIWDDLAPKLAAAAIELFVERNRE